MTRTGANGSYERCGYRWTSKECPQCEAPNDIAARYCCECKAEIVDPNEKLVIEFQALKRDPTRPQTDEVISVKFREGISTKGNRTIRADWRTPYRHFSTWHMPDAKHTKGMRDWALFDNATNGATVTPFTVSYVKDGGFFRILGYNRPADVEPAKDKAA